MVFIPDFYTYIEEKRKEYRTFQPVFCTALGAHVHFNTEGFRHLLFKTHRQPRPEAEQKHKLSLLSAVLPILAKSHTVYEYREEGVRRKVAYFALVGYYEARHEKVRVIVRKNGTGAFFFCSVMRHHVKKPKSSLQE